MVRSRGNTSRSSGSFSPGGSPAEVSSLIDSLGLLLSHPSFQGPLMSSGPISDVLGQLFAPPISSPPPGTLDSRTPPPDPGVPPRPPRPPPRYPSDVEALRFYLKWGPLIGRLPPARFEPNPPPPPGVPERPPEWHEPFQ